VELARAIGYKEHRITEENPAREYDAQTEWADVLKYLLIFAIARDWTAEDLVNAFAVKTIVAESYLVERRFLDASGPWIAFDIDDVLADYTDYMYRKCYPNALRSCGSADQIPKKRELNNTLSIGEQLGLNRVEWEIIKSEVRDSGGYREFACIEAGKMAVLEAMRLGYNILIITNRQMSEYPRLFHDTLIWLKQQGIPYHAVIFGSNKLHRLCRGRPDLLRKIALAVDDHPHNIRDYKAAGIPTALVHGRESNGAGIPLDNLVEAVADIGPASEWK
jgi:phosphoglycolate phosphatase-like HAD superfamily hydrolase